MIDRRTFLRRLGFGTVAAAAAATSVYDLERLLWVPGEKTIVIPPPAAFTNGFHSIEWIAREALRVLKQQLTLTAGFNRPLDNVRLGDTVQIPLPVRFEPFRPARLEMPAKTVTLDHQFHTDLDASALRYLTREQVAHHLEPHMAWMADRLRKAGVNVYGKLPVPAGVTEGCVVTSDHLSLRGLKAHDLEFDRELLRFDVVGGKA
jgi:hypothetical protein